MDGAYRHRFCPLDCFDVILQAPHHRFAILFLRRHGLRRCFELFKHFWAADDMAVHQIGSMHTLLYHARSLTRMLQTPGLLVRSEEPNIINMWD